MKKPQSDKPIFREGLTSRRVLFVVNVDWFFVSHRLPVALAALARGAEVHIATELTDCADQLQRLGLKVHEVPFGRGSAGLLGLIIALWSTGKVVAQVKPNLVHLVTIKPVLLGGLVAGVLRVPAKVSAISGLGFVFVSRGWVGRLRRRVVSLLYRLALKHPNAVVVFQNDTDREHVISMSGISPAQARMIRGSGVDLKLFDITPEPAGSPIVMMAARLIKDKGVVPFVQMARQLAGAGARFVLVGDLDPGNPASLSTGELGALKQEGVVEVWGHRSDMANVIAQATIFVLPSYYGEGLPKVLLEAAACGRPVVTTDIPGCRDAIVVDETGLLVPPRDEEALTKAVKLLLDDKERRVQMGRAGRRWVEMNHSIESVVDQHLAIYNELLSA